MTAAITWQRFAERRVWVAGGREASCSRLPGRAAPYGVLHGRTRWRGKPCRTGLARRL
jgi:hypothetical protein